jgi:flagellar protein FliJ
MARFHFRLDSLLKLREADREQRRVELAEAFRADTVLKEQGVKLRRNLQSLEKQSRDISSPGRVRVDQVLENHRYKLLLRSDVMMLGQKQSQLQTEIDRRREALVMADRDVRVLEKLRERKKDEHDAAELKRESQQLDEVAAQRWSRDRKQN